MFLTVNFDEGVAWEPFVGKTSYQTIFPNGKWSGLDIYEVKSFGKINIYIVEMQRPYDMISQV